MAQYLVSVHIRWTCSTYSSPEHSFIPVTSFLVHAVLYANCRPLSLSYANENIKYFSILYL